MQIRLSHRQVVVHMFVSSAGRKAMRPRIIVFVYKIHSRWIRGKGVVVDMKDVWRMIGTRPGDCRDCCRLMT